MYLLRAFLQTTLRHWPHAVGGGLAGALMAAGLLALLGPKHGALLPTLHSTDTLRVTQTVLVQGKPDTVVKWSERIIRPVVKPEHVLVSEGAGAGTVEHFCAHARVDTVRVGDSVRIVTTPPPSAVLIDAGTRRGSTLTLWSVRNTDSAGIRAPYRVGPGDFSFRAAGDSIIVQRDRFARLKQWAGRAALLGAGFVAGHYAPR